MAAMFGDEGFDSARSYGNTIKRTWNVFGQKIKSDTVLKHGAKEIKASEIQNAKFYDVDGKEVSGADLSNEAELDEKVAFITGDITIKNGVEIKINPDTFPGTYYVTGDQRYCRHAI